VIIPYKDQADFDAAHAAGSRIITASSVPALFGKSRFVGQTALYYHLTGEVPLPPVDTVLTRRGRRYERLAAEDVAEAKGWRVEQVYGYAEHPKMGRRFLASPDTVAWQPIGSEWAGEDGIGEAKTVAEPIYEELWAEGPPLDVELQHQAQFATTGAKWGYISALVIGAFRHDIVVYETAPNPAAIELIEKAAEAFLALLDAGTPPEPDQHETSLRALHVLYPKADPGKILLMEDDESASRFDEWMRARDMRLSAEKAEKSAKEWFQAQAQDAGLIRLAGGRSIEIKVIERAGYTVKATSYRKLDAKVIAPLIGGRVDI
jgi:hypothetical protein